MDGGTVSGAGNGTVSFYDNATASSATLTANGGTGGADGGGIYFNDNSSGGTSRVVLNGGTLDISGLSTTGTTVGSLEGEGTVSLGGKTLGVGYNNLSTTFSGLIRDGGLVNGTGGSLDVRGAGRLTLTGANTYTGSTNIGDGVNANSGKLVVANTTGSATGSGAVFVDKGGTLGGSGFIAGPVTLNPGGLIAPGDPVTLTLDDDLTWNGDSSIQLFLGENQTDSDTINILGILRRGTPGEFHFTLVDGGAVPGVSYELIHAASIEGFVPGDFTFSGIQGGFTFENGSLDFVPEVPEPTATWLLAVGGLVFATSAIRRMRV